MNDVFNQDNRNAMLDEIPKRASAISIEERAKGPSSQTGQKFSEWLDEAESIVEEKPVSPPRITPTPQITSSSSTSVQSEARPRNNLLGSVLVSSVTLTLMVAMYFGYMTFSQKLEETMVVMSDLKDQVATLKSTNEAQKEQLSELRSIVAGFALYQEALAKSEKLVSEPDFMLVKQQVEAHAVLINKVEPLVSDVNQNIEEVAELKSVIAQIHQQSINERATIEQVASLIESNAQSAQVDQTRVVKTLNEIQAYLNQQLAILGQVQSTETVAKTDTLPAKEPDLDSSQPVKAQPEPALAIVEEQQKPLSWIEQRDQNRVTLQLMRLKDKQKLEEFVKNQGLEEAYIYPSQASKTMGVVDYVLVYGDFATQEEADLGSKQLKQKVRWLSPWARKFSSVLKQVDIQ